MTKLEDRLKETRIKDYDREDELIELRELRKTDFIPIYGLLHFLYRTNLPKNEPEITYVFDNELAGIFWLGAYNLAIGALVYCFS